MLQTQVLLLLISLRYVKPLFPRTLDCECQDLNLYHYINYKLVLGIGLLWFCVRAVSPLTCA